MSTLNIMFTDLQTQWGFLFVSADEERVPEKFMMDRPFVFLLKYKCNIVLIGHVMEPEWKP